MFYQEQDVKPSLRGFFHWLLEPIIKRVEAPKKQQKIQQSIASFTAMVGESNISKNRIPFSVTAPTENFEMEWLPTPKDAVSAESAPTERDYELGDIYIQQDNFEQALVHLKRALEAEPDNPRYLVGMGYLHLRMTEKIADEGERETLFQQAEHELQKALEYKPSMLTESGESWWIILGELYQQHMQLDLAVQAYQKASEFTPYNYEIYRNLALLYMKQQKYVDMKRSLAKLETLITLNIIDDEHKFWECVADLFFAQLGQGKIVAVQKTLNRVKEADIGEFQKLIGIASTFEPYLNIKVIDLINLSPRLLQEALSTQSGLSKREQFV